MCVPVCPINQVAAAAALTRRPAVGSSRSSTRASLSPLLSRLLRDILQAALNIHDPEKKCPVSNVHARRGLTRPRSGSWMELSVSGSECVYVPNKTHRLTFLPCDLPTRLRLPVGAHKLTLTWVRLLRKPRLNPRFAKNAGNSRAMKTSPHVKTVTNEEKREKMPRKFFCLFFLGSIFLHRVKMAKRNWKG